MKLLTRIANLCGADKGTTHSESHGYTEIYDDFFSKYCGKEINILEIGIGDGPSLKMYDSYFDGKCNVYALDIEDKQQYDRDNIHTFICDQGSREELQNFKDSIGDIKFDFIIDDGSHFSIHQTISFFMLHDLLKEDGFYIIEDLHCYEWEEDYKEGSIMQSLIFNESFRGLNEDENDYLRSRIDTVQIWSRNNEKSDFNIKKSITSIIKLKH
jgi:hypothetical protein